MRVCGRFPNSSARATTVLALEHFRATADGGVYARQDHLRECSRRAVYRLAVVREAEKFAGTVVECGLVFEAADRRQAQDGGCGASAPSTAAPPNTK